MVKTFWISQIQVYQRRIKFLYYIHGIGWQVFCSIPDCGLLANILEYRYLQRIHGYLFSIPDCGMHFYERIYSSICFNRPKYNEYHVCYGSAVFLLVFQIGVTNKCFIL